MNQSLKKILRKIVWGGFTFSKSVESRPAALLKYTFPRRLKVANQIFCKTIVWLLPKVWDNFFTGYIAKVFII